MAKEQRMMCVEDFKENLCRYCNTYMSEEPCEPSECWVHDVIAQTGTVDAVEVVHGHWRYYSTTTQECSNCQRHTARHKFKYCPHCGAIMEDKYNDG